MGVMLEPFPDDWSRDVGGDARSMLTEHARSAGESFGCDYAVSFELVEL
jgi:hypothetical protein